MSQQNVPAGRQFLFNLRYFLTYTANLFVTPTDTFGFAWSLATEEQFYCAWPWVEKYCARQAAGVMAVFIGAVLAIQQGWISVPGFPKLLISHVAPSICFGVLLAHVLSSRRGYALAFHCVGFRAAPLILVLSTAMLISIRVDVLIPGIPYALIVAACVIREDHWLSWVLGCRGFISVGVVSYGMYLLHGLVYHSLEVLCTHSGMDRNGVPVFVAAVTLTFVVATISYRYYESWFLALKNKFTSDSLTVFREQEPE
jgi:peptidoglycan/LPS O-acetylase OafA/YrhL